MTEIEITGRVIGDMPAVCGKLMTDPPYYCIWALDGFPLQGFEWTRGGIASGANVLTTAIEAIVDTLRNYEKFGREPYLHARWTVGEVRGFVCQITPYTSFAIQDCDRKLHTFPWNTPDDEEAIH